MAGDVILYEGSPLERIAASSLVLSGKMPLAKAPQIYLASDVIVGKYGVTGLLLVDSKPKPRWESYTDGNWTGAVTDEKSVLFMSEYDPIRYAHYMNTSSGFKMIRYFILPPEVAAFFRQDSFLGDPMIDKCCRDGTLPEDYDEVLVNSRYVESSDEGRFLTQIINSVNPAFAKDQEPRNNPKFGQKVYFSFHLWQVYKPVTEVGEESIVRAITNFDRVLSQFDNRNILQQRQLVSPSIEYRGVLPPRPA